MKPELFITKKIIRSQRKSFSTPVVKISIASIAVCVAVMIIALTVVLGFKESIREKIIGFGSHITINYIESNSSYEAIPINENRAFLKELRAHPEIKHIQRFGIKAGVIRANKMIQGVVLKGIDKEYDWAFLTKKLIEGNIIQFSDTTTSNDVIISKVLANKLKLKLNDRFDMFFIQDPPRMRKFKVKGIYESGLEDFDKLYVFADIKHIQKLNNWKSDEIAGFEILIHHFDDIDKIGALVNDNIDTELKAETIKDRYPQLFDWLKLIDTNGIVILILMLAVAGITMISVLLILILERTNMIGILKAMGASDKIIRRIFIYQALYITLVGLFWGNLAGLTLCFLQQHFKFITLDQATYYVAFVPVSFNALLLILINVGTLLISFLTLLLPSLVISKITPIKAIRYN